MKNTKWKIDLPAAVCKEQSCSAAIREGFIDFDATTNSVDLVWICSNGHYNKTPCKVTAETETQQPTIRTKISGVSFDNPDGTNRQSLLQYVKSGDPIHVEQGVINERKVFIVRHAIGVLGVVKNDVIHSRLGSISNAESFEGKVIGITGGESGKSMLGCNIELYVATAHKEVGVEQADKMNNQLGHSFYVYIDSEKKNIFHTDPHCSGLKNAARQKYEYAKNVLKARPCKKCGNKTLRKERP